MLDNIILELSMKLSVLDASVRCEESLYLGAEIYVNSDTSGELWADRG